MRLGDRLLRQLLLLLLSQLCLLLLISKDLLGRKSIVSRDQRSTYPLLRYVDLIADRYAGRHHPLSW